VLLVRRRAPAELFATGLLLVMAFYFGSSDRLLLPIYLIAFPATVEVVRDAVGCWTGARTASAVAAAAVVLLAVVDLRPRHNWDSVERRHRQFEALARALDPQLEPDARIGAGLGMHYSVYLEQPASHDASRAGTARRRAGDGQVWARHHRALSPPGARAPLMPYFERRYGPPLRAASGFVWRVRGSGSR
jgi:hypothetical protein